MNKQIQIFRKFATTWNASVTNCPHMKHCGKKLLSCTLFHLIRLILHKLSWGTTNSRTLILRKYGLYLHKTFFPEAQDVNISANFMPLLRTGFLFICFIIFYYLCFVIPNLRSQKLTSTDIHSWTEVCMAKCLPSAGLSDPFQDKDYLMGNSRIAHFFHLFYIFINV